MASTALAVIFTLVGRLIIGEFAIISLGLGILGSAIGLFGMHYWQIAEEKAHRNIIQKSRTLFNTWLWKQALIIRSLLTIIINLIYHSINELQRYPHHKKKPIINDLLHLL